MDTNEELEAKNKATAPGEAITTHNGRRIVKMDRDTAGWEAEAYNTLVCMHGYPKACGECGHPVIRGYCCTTCGSTSP